MVKSGPYDRLLTKNKLHLGFINNKYWIIEQHMRDNYILT